jgi:uroporphyrin-III C-methyltransferase / precorrin-2 dehydrogenase / sirohydrochlorin ferrochelatase
MPKRTTPPFPIFLNLDGAQVLVVGNGDIAARRIEAVIRAGAQVRLAAAEIGAPMQHLMQSEQVTPLNRAFQPDDIKGCRLVMVATDDDDLNAQVSALAQAAGIPVNVADSLALCTFIMPAIVDRAPITAAISSGGAAPVLARRVKTAVESAIPANLGDLAAYAGEVRPEVNSGIADPKARRRFWQNFADGPIATHVLDGQMDAANQLVEKSIRELAAGQAINPIGEILIIAAGAGDPDLLSLRALRLMQRGDIMVHDSDVPIAILDIARKDAERIAIDDADTAWQRVSALANDGLSVLWVRRGAPEAPDTTALDGSGIVITSVPATG